MCSEIDDGALTFRLLGASWSLRLPPAALSKLLPHVQQEFKAKEAVGQLYSANPRAEVIQVDAVTVLPPRAARRAGVKLDMKAVQAERKMLFAQGLHCLGFWHTHPEPVPSPSPDDIALAADHARASREDFAGLVFAILGTSKLPEGLGVWVHDSTALHRAFLVPEPVSGSQSLTSAPGEPRKSART